MWPSFWFSHRGNSNLKRAPSFWVDIKVQAIICIQRFSRRTCSLLFFKVFGWGNNEWVYFFDKRAAHQERKPRAFKEDKGFRRETELVEIWRSKRRRKDIKEEPSKVWGSVATSLGREQGNKAHNSWRCELQSFLPRRKRLARKLTARGKPLQAKLRSLQLACLMCCHLSTYGRPRKVHGVPDCQFSTL